MFYLLIGIVKNNICASSLNFLQKKDVFEEVIAKMHAV